MMGSCRRSMEVGRNSTRLDKNANQLILRRRIPPNPRAGTPGAVAMRFCLPSGAKFTRSFLSSTPVPVVRDFVDIHLLDNSVPIKNYDLNVTYPRKKLQGDGTLEEEGIGNGTVVMIIDNDA